MISDQFRLILLKRLESFEQRIIYLHFFDEANETLDDKNKLNRTIELIHSVSNSLKLGILKKDDIIKCRELNERYKRYNEWLMDSLFVPNSKVKKHGNKTFELWNI